MSKEINTKCVIWNVPSIYGLKVSSSIYVDFEMKKQDHYVFVKRNKKCFVILLTFLATNNLVSLEETKSWFSTIFRWRIWVRRVMSLELRVIRICSKKLLDFSQENYIDKLLQLLHNSKPVDTPIEKGHLLVVKLSKNKWCKESYEYSPLC